MGNNKLYLAEVWSNSYRLDADETKALRFSFDQAGLVMEQFGLFDMSMNIKEFEEKNNQKSNGMEK